MKRTVLIATLIFYIIGCKEETEVHSTTFYTQDSLYKISFDKPIELDTFYAWTDWDDNECSDEHKYRFSKRNYPPQKETGFAWSSLADSTYRFTLKHIEKYDCKSGDMDYEVWTEPSNYFKKIKMWAQEDNNPLDTIFSKPLSIDNRNFIIGAFKIDEKYKNNYWTSYLKALTLVDSTLFVFVADCRTANCNGFIEKMEETVKSIKIEKVK